MSKLYYHGDDNILLLCDDGIIIIIMESFETCRTTSITRLNNFATDYYFVLMKFILRFLHKQKKTFYCFSKHGKQKVELRLDKRNQSCTKRNFSIDKQKNI